MFANGKFSHRVRAGAATAACVLALAACSTGTDNAAESPTATPDATASPTVSPTTDVTSPATSPTGAPQSCYFLVDKKISSDGDTHVGNFFAIADFPDQNVVTGQWWSPYGEDKGAFLGTVAQGKLTGEMVVESTEGGTTETVAFSEEFSVAGGKATLPGYKAVTEAEFRTYVSGTGFMFPACM